MNLTALLNLGGGEFILVLAIVLILLGAKKLPEFANGLWQGIQEFRKATQDIAEELTTREPGEVPPNRPVLMAVTFILGATSLILAIYELSR